MKERILEFLRAENKSSAQFADEIGVQPSSISHIISGRNNPSLDFVLKMLDRYKYISVDWLLFAKGPMYKDKSEMQSLFDQTLFDQPEKTVQEPLKSERNISPNHISSSDTMLTEKPGSEKVRDDHGAARTVVGIVWFYSDNSFEEYHPGR